MVKDSVDLLELLRKRGVDGDVDFLLEALRVVADAIMDADVSAKIGAEHGERSPDRLTYRNGYRSRQWDTRVGTMELRIPKLREGRYSLQSLPAKRFSWLFKGVQFSVFDERTSGLIHGTRRFNGSIDDAIVDRVGRSESTIRNTIQMDPIGREETLLGTVTHRSLVV